MSNRYKNLVCSTVTIQETPIELTIKGTIPDWLSGTLYKNGVGQFKFGSKMYKNLFDGLACVVKFEIKNGKVLYSNKLLETKTLKHNLENKKLYPMFGTTDPCSTLFGRLKAMFNKEYPVDDNVNVSVVPFGDQMYALTETSMIVRIDPVNMNIINTHNITDHIKPTFSLIAHPHIDDDGNWLSLGMQPIGLDMSYDFIKFKLDHNVGNVCEKAELLTRIPSSHPFGLSYSHSFGLTKNYIIFLEQCMVFDAKQMPATILFNRPISKAYKIDKNFQTKIHLIHKHTGKLVKHKYFTKPQFSFHHINAYETDEQIIVDLCSYKPNEVSFEDFQYDEYVTDDNMMFLGKIKSQVKRLYIPLVIPAGVKKTYCKLEDVCKDVTLEMPAINYTDYNTKPYEYVYGIGAYLSESMSIVKINVSRKNNFKYANIEKGENTRVVTSEPTFIEKPNASSEDDGVLLSIIMGDVNDFLLVLDAKTLEEICRADLPTHLKTSLPFHGFFSNKND